VKCIKVLFGYTKFYSVTDMLTELNLHTFDSLIDVEVMFNVRSMWQWHCTTFCVFAFDVTDSMLYDCVTVFLHTVWRIAITFYFFNFLLFYYFICFYCSMGSGL